MTAHPIGTPPHRPTVPPPHRPAVPPARRPAGRRALAAAVILLPVLELAVLIAVGSRIGAGVTVLLLLADVVAGVLVVRQAGAAAVARWRAPVPPAGGVVTPPSRRSPAETALVVAAGVLLALPGFLSDLVALALLVPGVRRAVARRAGDAVLRRVQVGRVRVVQGQVLDDGTLTGMDVRVAPPSAPSGPGGPTPTLPPGTLPPR